MRIKREIERISKKIFTKKSAPYLLVLFVVTLSVAYSAFGTQLNIGKFLADVRLQEDIRITGIRVKENSSAACTLNDVDSSGDVSLSDEVTCGTESFYVMSNNGNNVTTLSKYNLDVGENSYTGYYTGYASGIQNENAKGYISETQENYGSVPFSYEIYWETDSYYSGYWDNWSGYYDNYYDGYWTSNYQPAGDSDYPYVYDNNSNLYQYVENYEAYLSENGVSSASARLMSYEEAINLGCELDYKNEQSNTLLTSFGSCGLAPSWVYGRAYWLGTADIGADNIIFTISDGGWFGSTTYDSDWNGVRPVVTILDYEIDGVYDSNGGLSKYEDYNVGSISVGMDLPNEDSSIIYAVEVTNIEATEMGILEITGLPDNLEYELLNYNLEEKICDNSNKCNLGISKEIFIKIKYKDGSYDSSNTTFDATLNFNFQPFYTVTYTDIVNNGYPTEVMSGDTLKVDFGENALTNIAVKMNNVEISNYTYTDGVLTVPNVSGNIDISKGNFICTITSGNGASVGDEITCGTESFYVMDNDGSNVTMLAKYNLEVGYSRVGTTNTLISNPSGIQSSSAGYYNNQYYGVTYFSDYTYWDSENVDYSGYYAGYSYEDGDYAGYYVGQYSPAGDSNIPYIYDSHSNLYTYVENYESYLKDNGISSASATLMSYEQAGELGCSVTYNTTGNYLFSCDSSPSWLKSTSYWLGSGDLFGTSTIGSVIFMSNTSGDLGATAFMNISEMGVRPVVTISTSDLSNYEGRLPSEYQEVEYIESSGTQEISNFYTVPSSYTTIKFETKTNTSSSTEQGIIGIDKILELAYSTTKNRIALYDPTTGSLAYVSTENVLNNDVVLKASLSNGTTKTLYTDLDNGQKVTSSAGYTSINNGSVDLFVYSGATNYYFNGKLYYAKVRVDNKLVRHMIPCYRKSDGVIGMYDLVNDVFYTNTGTGTFTKGSNVS